MAIQKALKLVYFTKASTFLAHISFPVFFLQLTTTWTAVKSSAYNNVKSVNIGSAAESHLSSYNRIYSSLPLPPGHVNIIKKSEIIPRHCCYFHNRDDTF